MDLGEPFKRGMNIQPGEDGTFIVHVLGNTNGALTRTLGFTTIDDLLIWMARHGAKSRVTEMKQDQIVSQDCITQFSTDAERASRPLAAAAMDAINGLKRTTAAEIIREREAREAGRELAAAKVTGANAEFATRNTPTPAA